MLMKKINNGGGWWWVVVSGGTVYKSPQTSYNRKCLYYRVRVARPRVRVIGARIRKMVCKMYNSIGARS